MTTVKDAAPDAIELAALFKDAMEGPAKPREAATPPEIDPDAPHGRGDDGQPLAPYGWTKPQRKGEEPRPKLVPGRNRKGDDGTRVAEIAPAVQGDGKAKRGQPEPDLSADYSEGLAELHDAIWLGMSGLAKLAPKIPVVGRMLPEQKISAEAYVWHTHKPRLVGAMSLAAKHNAGAARFAARLGSGEATWVLMAGAMLMPVIVHTAAVLGGDDRLTAMDLPPLADLATANDQAMESALAAMVSQLEEAAEAGMAEAA